MHDDLCRFEGEIQSWAFKPANVADIQIVEAAPEVSIDGVNKQAALLHLKNNRSTPLHKRPIFQPLMVMLILSLMFTFSRGLAYMSQVEEIDSTTGFHVFEDATTGHRFVTEEGDSSSAVRAAELYASTNKELRSVSRWIMGSSVKYTTVYWDVVDSCFIADVPDVPSSNVSKDLLDFLIGGQAERIANYCERYSLPYGIEIIDIDGVPMKFRKWKLQAPNTSKLEYWKGRPVNLH